MPKFLGYFVKNQGKNLLVFGIVAFLFSTLNLISIYRFSKILGYLPYTLKEGNWHKFERLLLLFFVFELVTFIFSILYNIAYTKCRGYMNIFIRVFGVDKLIELDYSNLAKFGSGKLLQIVKNGVEAYSYFIFDGLNIIIEFALKLLTLIFILGYFNLRFVVAFLIGLGLIFFIQRFIYKKFIQIRERERDLNEEYTKQTAKIFMNFVLLKIVNLKERELNKLYEIGKERVNNYIWLKFRFGAGARFANILITFIFICSLYYLGKLFLKGIVQFSTVLLVSFLFLLSRRIFRSISFFISQLAEKWTYIERFDSLINNNHKYFGKETKFLEKSGKEFKKQIYSLNFIGGDIFPEFSVIKFENIWFKYEEQKMYLFEGFNFSFSRREKIAILGRSGSGKSTLFKMLVRLIEPEKGEIKIFVKNKGVSFKEIKPEVLYQKIGYFYQEPLIFDGTIRENLTLGLANVNDKELNQVMKIIKMDYLSLNTIIGERGVLLSGGERQRLALARAFVFDYEILLLDEPTSNLDLYLEKKILNEIFERYKDKTILVVSHRPYVLENVDRVVVMKKGEIILNTTDIKNIGSDISKYFIN